MGACVHGCVLVYVHPCVYMNGMGDGVLLSYSCTPSSSSPMQSDVGGAKLKDLMVDQGLVQLCVDYIHTRVPPAA